VLHLLAEMLQAGRRGSCAVALLHLCCRCCKHLRNTAATPAATHALSCCWLYCWQQGTLVAVACTQCRVDLHLKSPSPSCLISAHTTLQPEHESDPLVVPLLETKCLQVDAAAAALHAAILRHASFSCAAAAQRYPHGAILTPLLLCHSCPQMDAPAAALPAAP
jgi:hypothetical protein